eukprot:212550_1
MNNSPSDLSALKHKTPLRSMNDFNKKWTLNRGVVLGSGGQGTVYPCYRVSGNTTRDKTYCCKVMRFTAETRSRIIRAAILEYKLVIKCRLIRYKSMYLDDTNHAILLVMERMRVSLDQTYKCDLYSVMFGVTSKLRAMHSHGYAHLDIKPQNIMFSPRENQWVPIDYSLSQRVPNDNVPLVYHDAYGTKGWSAPELSIVRHHRSHLSTAADIYSLGLLVLNLINGGGFWRHYAVICGPKWSSNMYEYHLHYLRSKHGHREVIRYVKSLYSNGVIDRGLRRLLSDMLAFDPSMRPSIDQVFKYFERIHRKPQQIKASSLSSDVRSVPSSSSETATVEPTTVKEWIVKAAVWLLHP